MEQIGGGGAPFRCYNHHKRSSQSAERFLGVLQPQSSSATPPLELSEDDIFSTPSGSPSPSPTNRNLHPKPSPNRNINLNHHGILAALNGNTKKSGIGSEIRPVFNRKASIAASLSSSSSTSPATSVSSRIMIPRPPPPQAERERERVRMHPQSAPVNIPVMPESLRRRARDLEDLSDEEEEEEEDNDGVILPPHEVVASRHSLMLSCSVMEGAGRTLKGRDLRQVRNAVWRKTGLLD